MTRPVEKCGDCYFFNDAYCRRYPPIIVVEVGGTYCTWPDIAPSGWCGEYKPIGKCACGAEIRGGQEVDCSCGDK